MSRTRYARSGELRIAYELRGTLHRRRPWLVLIQGVGLDRSGWEPVLPKLMRQHRLVLVDNRGSGRSDLPTGSFDVADMAADVLAVLDRAGVRRAHIMGTSLGGMVAQELAIDHPERLDRLVLVSTTPGWPIANPMPGVSVRLIAATRSMTREVALRRHAENALSARGIQRRPELAGRLRQTRIRARTLVLHGAADTVVDPRNAKLLADRIPGAHLVIFPELGHLLFWQDPHGFTDTVTSFLTCGTSGTPSTGHRASAAGSRAGCSARKLVTRRGQPVGRCSA